VIRRGFAHFYERNIAENGAKVRIAIGRKLLWGARPFAEFYCAQAGFERLTHITWRMLRRGKRL